MKENVIVTKTFDFALSIVNLFVQLKKENELQQIEINQLKELVKNLINKK